MAFLSVQFSRWVVSDSLQPHGLQYARVPCPSPTPGVYSGSCPSSRWCHPTISSSLIPFSSCLQSSPASGSFSMSQFFTGGQSIGASASASVLPVNIQCWFPFGLTDLISMHPRRLFKSLLQYHISKAWVLWCSAFFMVPGFAVKPVITLFVYWKFTRWGEKGKFIWPGDFSFPGWPLLVLSQFPYLTASALSTPASQVALVVRNPSANAGQSCPFTLLSV